MANMAKPANDRDPKVRLRASESDSRSTNNRPANGLKLNDAQPQAENQARGFDPYNTSGSFDRKKHWERVGKR